MQKLAVVRQQRSGLPAGREKGVDASRYVVSPCAFERAFSAINKNDIEV